MIQIVKLKIHYKQIIFHEISFFLQFDYKAHIITYT
jgi:hypothetical protein